MCADIKKNWPQGKYIKKQDLELAKALAQKEYDQKLLSAARKQLQVLERMQMHYDPDALLRIKQKNSKLRRQLIDQRILDDEEYAKQWLTVEYQGRPFLEENPYFYTENNEKVRSKSEKMIADKLLLLGIPYRYECPIFMKSIRKEFYPDFTLLHKQKRKEYYLEHFGMMDDPEYLNNFLGKIECYAENDIIIGKNLIITFETQARPLDLRIFEKEIKEIFRFP